ncbi:MAG: dockerin type I domain-containing protein [Candidatus Zixiibacteriota bacterium]
MKRMPMLWIVFALLLTSGLSAQITNQQISSPSTQLQNEEQVFYCPTDSNIVVANWRDFRLGYRQCGIGRTTDGGTTWTDFLNPLQLGFDSRQSDPTMTVAANGDMYMCFLDYSPFYDDSSFVVFIKSTDKGATWTGPYPVENGPGPYFEDKQFVTADRTGGPYNGNVYVGWARFDNPTRIMFASSTDGAETFSDTLIIGPSQVHEPCGYVVDAGQFTQPIVGADGSVYVFWSGYDLLPDECAGYYAMKMVKSTDGGTSFTSPVSVFNYTSISYVDGDINVYNAPAGDADISDGPYDGNIYISTTNALYEDPLYHADVVMIRSTDGGATWETARRVNDDPLGVDVDQFHPWLIVNEDGVVVIIFYDQRLDPNHYNFDVFGAYSFDGGETFTTNYRITTVSSSPDDLKSTKSSEEPIDPYEGRFDEDGEYHVLSPMAGKIAEYIGVTAYHDNVTAVWTDTRTGNQDVFSASFTLQFLKPRLYGVEDGAVFKTVGDSLFWSTCWHESDVSYRIQIDNNSDFSSPEIETVLGDNKLYSASAALTDGTYFWRVKAYRTSVGDSTDYSDTWTFFRDATAPTLPILQYPIDDITISEVSPEFVWSYVAPTGTTELYEIEISADPAFSGTPPYFTYDGIADTAFTMTDALSVNSTYYWRINHYDIAGNESGFGAAESFVFIQYMCGDANGDLSLNVGDAVYLVNYIFKGGPPPDPIESGDANCDGSTNIGDAVYLVNYIFKGGPAPCCP